MSIAYVVDGHVARVTIDRADRMNAIDEATADELEAIWQQVELDTNIRVVILTGSGDRAFCAGADMKSVDPSKTGLQYWANARPGGFGGLTLRKSLHVPVIARVNGIAVGGGFELALGCDIIVASDSASFGLPEAKVGRMPMDGGMIMLPRLIPQKLAMGMLLTGQKVSAADGRRFGFVNEVVPSEELDSAVDRWVEQIIECAPLSVRAIKECVKETADLPIDVAWTKRMPALLAALSSEDADEGPLAFREKRKPQWKGC